MEGESKQQWRGNSSSSSTTALRHQERERDTETSCKSTPYAGASDVVDQGDLLIYLYVGLQLC